MIFICNGHGQDNEHKADLEDILSANKDKWNKKQIIIICLVCSPGHLHDSKFLSPSLSVYIWTRANSGTSRTREDIKVSTQPVQCTH